jgi:hypothetical protein
MLKDRKMKIPESIFPGVLSIRNHVEGVGSWQESKTCLRQGKT